MRLIKSRIKHQSLVWILHCLLCLISLGNVKCKNSILASSTASVPSCTQWSLVILLLANSGFVSFGKTVRDGKIRPFERDLSSDSSSAAAMDEDEIEKLIPKILRRRVSRQLSIIAPALQTMGCLPKFFCGMNSKTPSESTSSINDLAYLIKFAMVDEIEDRGKDDLGSDESDEDLQNKKFEILAEEHLALEDPEYLNFIWKDMKGKLRKKLKNGRVDEQVLNKLLEDMDKNKDPVKIPEEKPGFFSGLKKLMRFGRSVGEIGQNDTEVSGRAAVWEDEEFDNQMKLAARIGRSSQNDKRCSTTFNMCPYTVKQMKNMVLGVVESGEESAEKDTTSWYENNKGPTTKKPKQKPKPKPKPRSPTTTATTTTTSTTKPSGKSPKKPASTTTPSPIPNVIYLLNLKDAQGSVPSPPFTRTTTTKKPLELATRRVVPPRLQLPPKKIKKEAEDDEVGYDQPVLNYEKDVVTSLKIVKVLPQKLHRPQPQGRDDAEESEDVPLTSSEEDAKDVKLKIRPKGYKSGLNKLKPDRPPKSATKEAVEEYSEEAAETSSSEEDDYDTRAKNATKTTKLKERDKPKGKIGILRPKYSVKYKYKYKDTTPNTRGKSGLAGSQEKKEEIEASSEEKSLENKSESEEAGPPTKSTEVKLSEEKESSEEDYDAEKKTKTFSNSKSNPKLPQKWKYEIRNPSRNRLKFKKIEKESLQEESEEDEEDEEMEKKKKEMAKSSEAKEAPSPSSEELEDADVEDKGSGSNEQSEEVPQHPKPLLFSKPTQQLKGQVTSSVPENSLKSGGFLSSLFGNKKNKRVNQRPANPSQTKTKTEEFSKERPTLLEKKSKEMEDQAEEDSREDEDEAISSEEQTPSTTTTTPAPLPPEFDNLPNVFGTTFGGNEQPQKVTRTKVNNKKSKDKNRPVVVDPDKKANPTTPRPKKENRKKKKNPKPAAKKEKLEDSVEDDKSAEEEEIKEEEASEEVDPLHVKNIFTKASISSLGNGGKKVLEEIVLPPPPPIANWKLVHYANDPVAVLNQTSSTAKAATTTTVRPTLDDDEMMVPPESEENKEQEDDSKEGDAEENSKELTKTQDDEKSSEEAQQELLGKTEDDEAEEKGPLLIALNEKIPQIGTNVVSIKPLPMGTPDQSIYPAPAVAPVTGGFDSTNEIKVPMVPPTPSEEKELYEKLTKEQQMLVLKSPDEAIPKVGPGANAGTGGFPGGSPGGGLPGSGPGNLGGLGNQNPNAAQGTSGMGTGNNPGGGSGNKGQGGGNNRRPTSNPANNPESSEEKSEEEVGKSSEEEANQTSEEEDEDEEQKQKRRSDLEQKKDSEGKSNNGTKCEDSANKNPRNGDPFTPSSGVYPPLPPIYKWTSPITPTIFTRVKPLKPTRILPKPKPTKDTFYSSPLSPKLVQYLRETYGNAYVSPERKKQRTGFTTTTTEPPKTKPTISFLKTFQQSMIGQLDKDVIHLDDEAYDGAFGHRVGMGTTSLKVENKNTKTRLKLKTRPSLLPPIYGKSGVTLMG